MESDRITNSLDTAEAVPPVALVTSGGPSGRDLGAALDAAGLHPRRTAPAPGGGLPGWARPPSVVVLDLAACGAPMRNTLPALRAQGDFAILAVGDANDEAEEVAALRHGADDYLRHPVSPMTLAARVRAAQRRQQRTAGPAAVPEPGRTTLTRGALSMDALRHKVSWQGRSVTLSTTEYAVLAALARHPGHVKSRAQLLDAAYEDDQGVDDRTIDSHIKRLRRKLRSVDPSFASIETLYGLGYRFTLPA